MTVVVTDSDGDSGTATTTVTVLNVAPEVDAGGDQTITEGEAYFRTGSFTDPGNDQWTGTVDYGEGAGFEPLSLDSDKTFNLTHDYLVPGVFTVAVTVDDDGGGSGTASFEITVEANVAPAVEAGPGAAISEGDTFSSAGSYIDPNADEWSATVDYGDGGGPEALSIGEDKTLDLSHEYTDEGIYTVTVVVTDDNGGSGSDTATVTVANVAPSVDAGPGASISEGSNFSSTGAFADPGGDTWTATVDYGDGEGPVALPLNADKTFDLSHVYADERVYTVTVVVDDGDGGIDTDTAAVAVANVAPAVDAGGDIALFAGGSLSRSGTFVDPGDDTWTATVDYGEGAGAESLSLNSDKSFNLSHTYPTAGTFLVAVSVDDGDGGTGAAGFTVIVVDGGAGPGAGLNAPAPSIDSVDLPANFSTTGQDIWGPVTGGAAVNWQLFLETWSVGDSDSDIAYNVGPTSFDFGGAISGATHGKLGMSAGVADLSGSVDVTYPVIVTLNTPSADSFLAGQTVDIGSAWSLGGGATINATETRGDLRLDGQFEFGVSAGATLCVFSCTSWSFLPTIDWHPSNFNIFNFQSFEATPRVPSGLGISGNLKPVSVRPTTVTVSPDGTIVATGRKRFSNLVIDLDKLTKHLGNPIPLNLQLVNRGGAKIGYTLLNADATINFWAEQQLSFRGQTFIRLDFSRPVGGIVGSVQSVDPGLTWVVYEAGQQIKVVFPAGETDPITVTPTVSLSNSFTNVTGLETESFILTSAGSFDFNLPSENVLPATTWPHWHHSRWDCHTRDAFGTCWWWHAHGSWRNHALTPAVNSPSISFGLGPLFGPEELAPVVTPNDLANDTFSLGGFSTLQLASFELNPEVPPVADAGGPYTVAEASTVVLDGSASFDPDGDPITFRWDLDGDSVFETVGAVVNFTLGVDGPSLHAVTLEVCDDLNCDFAVATVTVTNVPPTLSVITAGPQPVDEGSPLTLTATFTDPAWLDTHLPSVDCGFAGADIDSLVLIEENSQPDSTGDIEAVCTYGHAGDYTVSITVTDDDDGSDTKTLQVTVANVAPTLSAITASQLVIDEGSSITFTATFSDPSWLDTHTASLDCGFNDLTPDSLALTQENVRPDSTGSIAGICTYGDNGVFTVTLTVTDDVGASDSQTVAVTVHNVAPVITTLNAPMMVFIDAVLDLDGKFTDVGFEDTHTVVVDWGDTTSSASSAAAVVQGAGSGSFSASHTYAVAQGATVISVTVTDDDGGQTFGSVTVIVKAPGRMTGGGRVDTGEVEPVNGKGKPKAIHISHGFVLFVNRDGPFGGNLQYDHHGTGDVFHVTEFASIVFTDDPLLDPGNPEARFDTAHVTGTGRLNGVDGVQFAAVITDLGEPGQTDTFSITFPGGESPGVGGVLNQGNHQAHGE